MALSPSPGTVDMAETVGGPTGALQSALTTMLGLVISLTLEPTRLEGRQKLALPHAASGAHIKLHP